MAKYIHELPDWPHFHWSHDRLAALLASVRHRQGRFIGRMEGLGFQLRAEAVLQSLTEEVIKSSEIEGEFLDREQVRSSIARRLGLDIGGLIPADRHVEGVVEMMLDATQNYAAPLTRERLFDWHAALFPTGRNGMSKIITGAWRDDSAGPMQVVSGPMGRERVHYEAPSAERVETEMRAFLAWFNRQETIEPVLGAAVAHLWFVTIHPFEDGNGRIARTIADMALARSEQSPRRFYSMSAQIRAERKAYYDILEATQKGDLDITFWLEWFLGCLDRAFTGAEVILTSVLQKARFWDAHAAEPFNDRQRAIINRLLNGFEGKLTSSKYATLAKCSQDTASRDIDDLLRRGVMVKDIAGGRSTAYWLIITAADALKAVAASTRAHLDKSVVSGSAMLTLEEASARRTVLEGLATKIDRLAQESRQGGASYAAFEVILEELRRNGFSPDAQLVSAVACAMQRGNPFP